MSKQSVYGGQAVMEGVMMRGRKDMAVAVRAPSGEIALYNEEIKTSTLARKARPLPFIRGMFMLWDTMLLGMRALVFSANVGLNENEESIRDGKVEEQASDISGAALWVTVGISILFSIGLFFVLPLGAIAFLDRYIASDLVSNIVEGGIRLLILVGYMLLIGQMSDIKRVFGYHGAEHKTINAFEAGDPLDVEHVREHSISHPRCGTGFLLVVVLMSIFVFALLGRPDWIWRISSRIFLVPFIAGIAYEFIKLTAMYYHQPLVRLLVAPSMALQRLTTRNPDDGMLEVAIASFKSVRVTEGEMSKDELGEHSIVEVDTTGTPVGSNGDVPADEPVPTIS